jgi:hypothetical protein
VDPNEALEILRKLAKRVISIADEPDYSDNKSQDHVLSEAMEMAEAFKSLDEWISKGGFLPKDWEKSESCRGGPY